jgi:hypothetical protein
MYKVYRFGRQHSKNTFKSYEDARSAVRKTIRAMYAVDGSKCTDRSAGKVEHTTRWRYSNASLGDFGFSIKPQ